MKFQNKKMSLVFVGIVLALSLLSIHSSAQSWLAFYKIETWTGKVDGAGTDANVFITLFGNRGTTREISLDNSENNFEWGKWDEFRARAREVGNIQKIRIRHDNSGRGPGWFLDKVRVTGSQGSKVFPVGRWLARDEEERAICLEVDQSGEINPCVVF